MKEEWKLFLDQNIRVEVKAALSTEGLDTVHASEVQLQRALDSEIFQYACDNNRILVTRDADFGDPKFFSLPEHHPGVIRLRIDLPLPTVVARAILSFVKQYRPADVCDALVIVTTNKVRFRR